MTETTSPDEIWIEEIVWNRFDDDEDHLLWVGRNPSTNAPSGSVRYVRAKDQTP